VGWRWWTLELLCAGGMARIVFFLLQAVTGNHGYIIDRTSIVISYLGDRLDPVGNL